MHAGQIAEVAAGISVVALGILVLRFNTAVAEHVAEWNKFKYDRRATLYDLDRAERLRKLYEAGPLDRLGAAMFGVILLVVGAAVLVGGLS
jgi:hypothetical protein